MTYVPWNGERVVQVKSKVGLLYHVLLRPDGTHKVRRVSGGVTADHLLPEAERRAAIELALKLEDG